MTRHDKKINALVDDIEAMREKLYDIQRELEDELDGETIGMSMTECPE